MNQANNLRFKSEEGELNILIKIELKFLLYYLRLISSGATISGRAICH